MVNLMIRAAKKATDAVFRGVLERRKSRRMHKPSSAVLAVNFVSSWDRQCGIATYTEFLAKELKDNAKAYVTDVPQINGANPYFKLLGYSAGRSFDLVHVQFEYGIFPKLRLGRRSLTAFSALLFYLGLSTGNRVVVTTMHEPRKAVTAGGRSGLLYTRLLDRAIFSVSDRIVVHTKESKRLLETVYGVKPVKLRIIPHGSYEQPHITDKETAKTALGLHGKTVVTILGFVTAKKGHDLALPLLPKLSADVQLVIAGGPQNSQDEAYMEKLKQFAQQYGVSERVTFTGYLDDLAPVLNASDIALLPYRYVTDSGVLHLLVSYMVPTLASDLAAFKEVHDEYGCIDVFRSGDSEDLLGKLQVLLSDSRHQAVLKAKCFDMWNQTRWSNIAKRHIELYREALNRGK